MIDEDDDEIQEIPNDDNGEVKNRQEVIDDDEIQEILIDDSGEVKNGQEVIDDDDEIQEIPNYDSQKRTSNKIDPSSNSPKRSLLEMANEVLKKFSTDSN